MCAMVGGALSETVATVSLSTKNKENAYYVPAPEQKMFRDRTEPTLFQARTVPETVPVRSLVTRYLSAPPTSVDSEHLYGSASHVFTDRCNRLGPKKADMMLFIKHNLPLISFNY